MNETNSRKCKWFKLLYQNKIKTLLKQNKIINKIIKLN